jgi:hypothetical protein
MTVRVSDDPEVIEEGTMTRMSAPGGVSACFQTPDDRDVFVFSGQKGKKWIASAIGADLQFRILGPDGAEVGRSEPTTPDTMIEFVTPGDGDYRVECTPLNYVAGPEVVYHLRITVPRDDHNKKK